MSDQKDPSGHQGDGSRVVVLLVGAALVIVGLALLARQYVWPAWLPVARAWDLVRGLGWGLGLIIIGILIVVVSQRKGFTAPAKGTRLYRSRTNKMISGVFGGLAEYLSMDATLLRLLYVGLALLFSVWPAIVAYIVAVIIVPEEPERPAEMTTPAPPQPPAAPPPAAPPAEAASAVGIRQPSAPVAAAPPMPPPAYEPPEAVQPAAVPEAPEVPGPPAAQQPPVPPAPPAAEEPASQAPDADVTHE